MGANASNPGTWKAGGSLCVQVRLCRESLCQRGRGCNQTQRSRGLQGPCDKESFLKMDIFCRLLQKGRLECHLWSQFSGCKSQLGHFLALPLETRHLVPLPLSRCTEARKRTCLPGPEDGMGHCVIPGAWNWACHRSQPLACFPVLMWG